MAEGSNVIGSTNPAYNATPIDGAIIVNIPDTSVLHSPFGSLLTTSVKDSLNELDSRSGFVKRTINNHGFTFQGQGVALDQYNGYIPWNANSDSTSTPVGVVYNIIDSNNVIIKTFSGEMQITSGQIYINGTLQNLSDWIGWNLFMSENTPGGLSSTPPVGSVSLNIQISSVLSAFSVNFNLSAIRTYSSNIVATKYSIPKNHKAYCVLSGAKGAGGVSSISSISGTTINWNFTKPIIFSHDDCSEEICPDSSYLYDVTVPNTANQTYYIIKERGNPTPVYTTVQPTINYGPPIGLIGSLNQYLLDISSFPYEGYKYNGSNWVLTPHCGNILKVVVGVQGVISSLFNFSFNGKYKSNWFPVSPNSTYPISHLIGSDQVNLNLKFSTSSTGSNPKAIYSANVLRGGVVQMYGGGNERNITDASLDIVTGENVVSDDTYLGSGYYKLTIERDF